MAEAWRHLLPLVDALVADGNRVVGRAFSPAPGGYACELAEPLDFDLLRSVVASDDANVHLSPSSDLLWCSHCWASVFGPSRVAEAQRDG